MAIARFIPALYDHFLDDKATFKRPAKDVKHPVDFRDYPHYVLFLSVHMGRAFEDEEIIQNIEKINAIPASDLTAETTLKYILDKYGLIYTEARWD